MAVVGVLITGMAFVIYRFGLLAYIVTSFWFFAFGGTPLTTDFSVWYATGVMIVFGLFVATSLWGFATATRGRFAEAPTVGQ